MADTGDDQGGVPSARLPIIAVLHVSDERQVLLLIPPIPTPHPPPLGPAGPQPLHGSHSAVEGEGGTEGGVVVRGAPCDEDVCRSLIVLAAFCGMWGEGRKE